MLTKLPTEILIKITSHSYKSIQVITASNKFFYKNRNEIAYNILLENGYRPDNIENSYNLLLIFIRDFKNCKLSPNYFYCIDERFFIDENAEFIKLLYTNKNFRNYNKKAIRFVARNGHSKILEILLKDPKFDPSIDDNFPMIIASRNGHINIVKLLLSDDRVNTAIVINLAIVCAMYNGHNRIVKELSEDRIKL